MENIIMFFNNKDSQDEIHHLNQATTLEISENSPLDAIFSKTGSETSSSFNPFNLSGIIKMKHHAKNAVALSLLSSFLMMGGTAEANTRTLKDIEPNNVYSNQNGHLHEPRSSAIFNGHVSKNDRVDVYSISDFGTHEGRMHWYLYSQSRILSMDVYNDVNENRRLDASDPFLFRIDQWGVKTISSSKGRKYLAKVWTNHHATNNYQNYSITVSTPKTLKLNIISASSPYYKRFDPRHASLALHQENLTSM